MQPVSSTDTSGMYCNLPFCGLRIKHHTAGILHELVAAFPVPFSAFTFIAQWGSWLVSPGGPVIT